MKKILVLLILICALLITSCTQETVYKYRCEDGTWVDERMECAYHTCPKVNCSDCPVETKTVTNTVIKNIYICPDGETEVDDKEDCEIKFLSDADYELGDEVIAGDFKWTFNSFYKTPRIGSVLYDTFYGAEANGEFLVIDVKVENMGMSAQSLSASFVKLIDEKNREFSSDTTAAIYLKPSGSGFSFYETINPGIVKEGKIVFDIPSGLKIAKIRVASNLLEDSFANIKLII